MTARTRYRLSVMLERITDTDDPEGPGTEYETLLQVDAEAWDEDAISHVLAAANEAVLRRVEQA